MAHTSTLESDNANAETGAVCLESMNGRPWLGDLSHALRTPIATIQNYCELLLACPPEDESERREFVRTVAQESEHLSRLVRDLVDLERASNAASTSSATGPCNLRDAVQRAALSLNPLATERAVTVEVDCRERIAVTIGSPGHIERALEALVENAIRYSPPGAIVTVTLSRHPSDPSFCIAVRDRGLGVAAADSERMFERFFRGRLIPDADRFKSSGLGLTLARAIAEQHQGEVYYEVASPGSCFSLRLPARPE